MCCGYLPGSLNIMETNKMFKIKQFKLLDELTKRIKSQILKLESEEGSLNFSSEVYCSMIDDTLRKLKCDYLEK